MTAPPTNSDTSTAATNVNAGAYSITVANGGSDEITGPSAASVTFSGTNGTLKLDDSLTFKGKITGLTGSDAIDLSDISFGQNTKVTFLGNAAGGTLTVTDGAHTANLALTGNYLASGWNLSSDGKGGTIVVDPVAADAWKRINIGAGGYLTGIDIAPDGTMVVRTDTYGAYIWNGTAWQQLVTATSMPAQFTASPGQGVYEIQIAPSNSNILYMLYDGIVFKSTDKGTTWKSSSGKITENPNDTYRIDGQKMAIDPNNPNIVYVGTPRGGLLVTTNGGGSWHKISAIPVSTKTSGLYPGITGIEFVPSSGTVNGRTKIIFASSYGHGVYKSTNGGSTWSRTIGGPTNVENAAVSATGDYYAVGNGGTSVWVYANGAWRKILTGGGIHGVAIDPFNPNHVVVANMGGALDQSFDGGKTWSGWTKTQQLNATDIPWLSTTGPGLSLGGLAFDPNVPGKLWVSSGVGVWYTSVPHVITSSTSILWNSQNIGIEQLVANDIIVPVGGKPVLGSWDRSFFCVNDPSSYPTSYGVSGQPKFAAGWSLDYASSDPNFVVGIADWWGREESGYSTDGGKDWQVFATMPPFAGKVIGGSIAASSPTDVLWAPADGATPYYTLDGGHTWRAVVLPGVTNWSQFDSAYYLDRRTVTADRVLANTFYMYYVGPTNSGVYRSSDGGVTWTEVFSGQISAYSNFNAKIQSVPGEAGNLFFTGGPLNGNPGLNEQFYQSKDGGATWTPVANVTEVRCFGFGAPPTPGGYPSIYIVGFVNAVYGIWQSDNDGQSWKQIGQYPDSQLSTIKTISGDPTTYGEVYIGFAGNGYAYLPGTTGTTAATVPPTGNSAAGPTVSSVVGPAGDFNADKLLTLTVHFTEAVTVTGGRPKLLLNDGGTAVYASGSGTSTLTFNYTVTPGQNAGDLAVIGFAAGTASVSDASGNVADFLGASVAITGLKIDTLRPTVTSVVDTPANADLGGAKVVTFALYMSEVVAVAGGVPTLTLNDGGVAKYTGGSGTDVLRFSYTVAAGQNTADLRAIEVNLNSATVVDRGGNLTNFSGALTNPAGMLQIDTTPPDVRFVDATVVAGATKSVTMTVHFTEVVDVNVTSGRPSLTLTNGEVATYTGGSGTNALTFSYNVPAGQLVPNLAVTAFNLNKATIKDRAGNLANLSAAFNAAVGVGGTLEIATPYSGVVRFAGATGTLKIDNVGSFKGSIAGQLTVGDSIDLPTVTAGSEETVHYSGSDSAGTLTVSDGVHTAAIKLLGNYSLANFTVSNDGHGGTLIADPPISGAANTGSALTPLDQQLALWAQHVASAFPAPGFGGGDHSAFGHAQSNGDYSHLAQPGAGRAHG